MKRVGGGIPRHPSDAADEVGCSRRGLSEKVDEVSVMQQTPLRKMELSAAADDACVMKMEVPL